MAVGLRRQGGVTITFVSEFGPPDINELKLPSTSLRSKLIQIEIFSPDHKDKSYLKKVPYNISVHKLAGLTQRLFNTGCEMPKLTCIHFEVHLRFFFLLLAFIRMRV